MTAPAIARVWRDLDRIRDVKHDVDLLADIRREYAWLSDMAHHPVTQESVKVRTSTHDPVSSLVAGQIGDPGQHGPNEVMRQACEEAADLVKAARVALETAASILRKSQRFAQGRKAEEVKLPGTLLKTGELEAARAAKARREGRGEGYGVG